MREAEPVFELVRPAWQARSNCHPLVIPHVWQEFGDHPVDLFYSEEAITRERRAAIAKVCGPCPVARECRAWAVEHELEGFWGGVGSTTIARERKATGVKLDTPEIDPRTRKVIGTFYDPPHGTAERYALHMRPGGDKNPCEACTEARAISLQSYRAEKWQEIKRTETPESRRVRLAVRRGPKSE